MAHFILTTKLIELLRIAQGEGNTYAQITEKGQLALGPDPLHPASTIDLSGEVIRPLTASSVVAPITEKPSTARRLSRQTGKYLLDIRGKTSVCTSLKELLAEGLRGLEHYKAGTLDKLSRVKHRTKRIVAREARSLFDQPHLAQDYAERLMDGWWYGTNNSADETKRWLKQACEIAGLEWGKDFTTSA